MVIELIADVMSVSFNVDANDKNDVDVKKSIGSVNTIDYHCICIIYGIP
jgi:hypothetical protein